MGKCKCVEFELIQKGPHLGKYCVNCEKWHGWVKQNKESKTKEEHKKEYMSNQPHTEKQEYFLRRVVGYFGEIRNRLHASELISRYKDNSF